MRPRTVTDKLTKIEDWPKRAEHAQYQPCKMADLLDVKPRELRRFIRKKFGCSLRHQLDVFRQLKAETLAKEGLPAKLIACELHFKQVSHLSRQFKHFHGIPFRIWLKEMNQISTVTPAGFDRSR